MGELRMDLGPVVRGIDVPLLRLGLKLVQKAVKDAKKGLDILHVDGDPLIATDEQVKALADDLDGNVDRDEFSITEGAAIAADIGLRLMQVELEKIADRQRKWTVDPRDTRAKDDEILSLRERIRGETIDAEEQAAEMAAGGVSR